MQHFIHFAAFILTLCVKCSMAEDRINKTSLNDSPSRDKKVFSLFNVVQFPNQVCTTNSGTYSNGTCVTASECSNRGGASQGSCAAGFGVCCVYSRSATGSRISQNTSYIVNPNYPSNYAPTSTPTTLTYTIEKCSCDVCRIRLDYENFEMTQPLTAGVFGHCSTEHMQIKTTAHQTTSVTTSNYGNYPVLCGTNTGQHSYIDMSCTCSDTAELTFTLSDTTSNFWKIKVTQISCNDQDSSQNEGCFQYFTGTSGTISSYNVQGNQMLASHNYAVCVRPEAGYCCIEYTPTIWDIYSGTADETCLVAADGSTDVGTTLCNGANNCWQNYVIFPGAESPRLCKVADSKCYHAQDGTERYCGTVLSPTGGIAPTGARLNPIISCQKPFRLTHVTGASGVTGSTNGPRSTTGVGVANTDGNEGATGFTLNYRLLPGNC